MFWFALQPLHEPAAPADGTPGGADAEPASSDGLADAAAALAWWALQFTPRVALLGQTVLLEISTSERLFGGRRQLILRIRATERPVARIRMTQAGSALLALARLRSAAGPQWWVRSLQTASSDIRKGLLTRGTGPGVVLASAAAVAGNAALFLVAARAAGTLGTTRQLLPLALFVLLAMSVPANLAGWGPREGAAAWVFSAAGLGAAQGLSAAVAYGILSLAACLPGAAVLAAAWFHNTRQRAGTPAWREGPGPAGAPPAGAPPTGKGGAPHA